MAWFVVLAAGSGIAGQGSWRGAFGGADVCRGLAEAAMENVLLPEAPDQAGSVDNDVCAICFVPLPRDHRRQSGSPGSPGSIAWLPCGHAYCDACIRPWLARSATCPKCRADFAPAASNASSASSALNAWWPPPDDEGGIVDDAADADADADDDEAHEAYEAYLAYLSSAYDEPTPSYP